GAGDDQLLPPALEPGLRPDPGPDARAGRGDARPDLDPARARPGAGRTDRAEAEGPAGDGPRRPSDRPPDRAPWRRPGRLALHRPPDRRRVGRRPAVRRPDRRLRHRHPQGRRPARPPEDDARAARTGDVDEVEGMVNARFQISNSKFQIMIETSGIWNM